MKKLRVCGASLVLGALTMVPFGSSAGAQEVAPAADDGITVAAEGVDARLRGEFRVRVRITSGAEAGEDRRFRERVRFRPRCDSGVCERVRFRVRGGFLKLNLNRQREGVYKGRDKDRVRCDTGGHGRLRSRVRVKIVESNSNDVATRVRGRVRLELTGCGDDERFTKRAKFRGNRR